MPEREERARKEILVSFLLPCQSGSGKSVGQTKCCTVIESGKLVRCGHTKKKRKKGWVGVGEGTREAAVEAAEKRTLLCAMDKIVFSFFSSLPFA